MKTSAQNQIIPFRPKKPANKHFKFARGICIFCAVTLMSIAVGALIYAIGQAIAAASLGLAIACTSVLCAAAWILLTRSLK